MNYTFTEDQVRALKKALQFYANEEHSHILSNRSLGTHTNWQTARDALQTKGFRFNSELYNGDEEWIEKGVKAQKALDMLEEVVYDTDMSTLYISDKL